MRVTMLLHNSAPGSVEASMSFASDHGDQGLLCEWLPAKTWHGCPKCGELLKDESELLTACSICVNSGPSLMCKRRKLQKSSVIVYPIEPAADEVSICAVKKDPPETRIKHESNVVMPPVIVSETYDSDFGGFDGFDHSQRVHDNPCLEIKYFFNCDVNSKSQIVGSNRELRSDNIPSSESETGFGFGETDTEVNDISECPHSDVVEMEVFDEDLSIRELCVSVLKSYGLLVTIGDFSMRSSGSTEVLGTCSGSSFQSCKLCGSSDNTLNMLLCDYCDEAFHASCCSPKIKILPTDNWFCHCCSKLNCEVSKENFLKLPSIWSNGISRFEMGPIALMLKYPEPYKSPARIGDSFQAEVPDWSDQISDDVDCVAEPLEMDLVEPVS